MAVQVKAINGSTWQFDIRKFSDARMDEDGKSQKIGDDQHPEPFPELMCVLVALKDTGRDRFFILEWKELRDLLVPAYKAYLNKHGGTRPKAPGSFHTAIAVSSVEPYENKWDKIRERVT